MWLCCRCFGCLSELCLCLLVAWCVAEPVRTAGLHPQAPNTLLCFENLANFLLQYLSKADLPA